MFQLALVVVAAVWMSSCCAQNEPKFNAKEYAKFKTEKLDKLVELTDAQEMEVYALYLEQGKQIKKGIKEMKKDACGQKKAACDKAKCDKPACDKKANCTKDCKKAECAKDCTKKAECKKDCKVACEKKAECKKAECTKKAECKKGACDKAKCDKPACDKAKCDKKANCDKKAKCDKAAKPRRPRVNPAERKAFFEKMNTILTPEQQQTLKTKMMERRARRGVPSQAPQCAPSCSSCPSQQTK